MDSDTIWRHTDNERMAVADILEGLTDAQWRHPSLCSEWSVRDIASHMTFAQVTLLEALVPALRAGFRSNAMVRDMAIRNPGSREEIIARIRSFVGTRGKPPFVSEMEPMIDVLMHTQDICVPLGIEHEAPAEAMMASIERLYEVNEGRFRLRRSLRGIRMVAVDEGWSFGSGRVVEGPLKWLLLAAGGRQVAHEHLTGDVEALTAAG